MEAGWVSRAAFANHPSAPSRLSIDFTCPGIWQVNQLPSETQNWTSPSAAVFTWP
jgi:hypothetical protein